MKKFILLALFAFAGTAYAAKWEYKTVDYESKDKFEPIMKTLGEEGWELTTCPTTGSSTYTAMISSGGSFTGYIGRSVYCIFKRQVP